MSQIHDPIMRHAAVGRAYGLILTIWERFLNLHLNLSTQAFLHFTPLKCGRLAGTELTNSGSAFQLSAVTPSLTRKGAGIG